MIHRVLGWFAGFLLVSIQGKNVERFINLCKNNRFDLWQISFVERKGQDCLFFKIALHDFYKLRPIARKCKVHPLIIRRYGFPFMVGKMKRHKSFCIGVLCFVGILFFLSGRIWGIYVRGESYHSKESLLRTLEQMNVYGGMAANDLTCNEVEEKLRHIYTDIGWASVELKGSKIYVRVKEVTVPSSRKKKQKGHLIAREDAKVVSIVTRKGTAKKRSGNQVKKGDILYLKTPEKITGTFKIHNAFVRPELMSLKLGEDINENYFMANGTAQYLPFTKKTNGGLIVRIVDLNLVATPNIKIEVQKKNGAKWTSVSKQISVKKGKKFDLYTHMNGTTAKDIQFALKKGEYRLKIMAKAGCVSQIAAYESDYQHLAKDSYGKTKKKAVNLYKTDFDLESNDMYYRFGYYFNEDKANTRWYRFVKTNKKQGALTIYNNMLSSGGFTASIYKKGTKKAVKTYRFDSKHMKGTSSDTKIVKYKLKTKGTYYIKISRNSKKVTGQYGVCFNYAK